MGQATSSNHCITAASQFARRAADLSRNTPRDEWYYGRRAYGSALVHYDGVNKSELAWMPKALLCQHEVYGMLEHDEERAEVWERLLREYPGIEAAGEVRSV